VVYGYRLLEQKLPSIGQIKNGVVISPTVRSNPSLRPPVKISLGCHIPGTSLPHVDPTDTDTVIAGVKKRFAMKPPDPDRQRLLRLKFFVYLWCCENLTPLSRDTDLSVDAWLENTGYSRGRINELKDKWFKCGGVLEARHYRVKSFVKDESYPEFKHARWINARTDEFKCAVGPTFKAIESVLFKSDWFIKKIPVKDRAAYIKKRCYRVGGRYLCSDYTAFESHFTAELFECCEFVMYDYMVQHLPNAEWFKWMLRNVIAGDNVCVSKLLTVVVPATRMSGEMCTSLGNGFSNLMFFLFLAKEKGCVDVVGVVEGDDGLFTCSGDFPNEDDYRTLGLTIKIQEHENLATASFCGLIFDIDDCVNIADPMKILAQTGFSTQQYVFSKDKVLRGLLKAKAFSLAYQYPGCPIIASFSRYLLRSLADDYVYFRKGNSDYTDLLQKEAFTFWMQHKEVLEVETPLNTRLLCERTFGISVADQLALELWFDSLSRVQLLDNPIILRNVPLVWRAYGEMYMMDAPADCFLIRRWYD